MLTQFMIYVGSLTSGFSDYEKCTVGRKGADLKILPYKIELKAEIKKRKTKIKNFDSKCKKIIY